MTQAIRGHNHLRVTMAIAALAVLLLVLTLVAVVQTVPTTGDANPVSQSMSAEGKGGSSLAKDPIHRHVEVVERLGGGSLRSLSREGDNEFTTAWRQCATSRPSFPVEL